MRHTPAKLANPGKFSASNKFATNLLMFQILNISVHHLAGDTKCLYQISCKKNEFFLRETVSNQSAQLQN